MDLFSCIQTKTDNFINFTENRNEKEKQNKNKNSTEWSFVV